MIQSIFLLLVAAQAIFGKIWSPSDLKSVQKDALTKARALDAAVQQCTTKLGPAVMTSWNNFFSELTAFCQTDFGWVTTVTPDGKTHIGGGDKATADQLQQYIRDLFDWGKQIEASGCTLVAPNAPPTETNNLAELTPIVKYAAVAIGFVGSAYIVGQLASTIRVFHETRPAK